MANHELLIPWWLMACYAYYEMDDPIISDPVFDWVTSEIKRIGVENFTHRHACLIDEMAINCGTGFDIKYPEIVKSAARHKRRQ